MSSSVENGIEREGHKIYTGTEDGQCSIVRHGVVDKDWLMCEGREWWIRSTWVLHNEERNGFRKDLASRIDKFQKFKPTANADATASRGVTHASKFRLKCSVDAEEWCSIEWHITTQKARLKQHNGKIVNTSSLFYWTSSFYLYHDMMALAMRWWKTKSDCALRSPPNALSSCRRCITSL